MQKGKLRIAQHGRLTFWCPGCNEPHGVVLSPYGGWTFNGNYDRPTFRPSVLVTSGHYCQGHKPGDHCWCVYNREHPDNPSAFRCERCHTYITDGKIQFLKDCTHELAGKTIDLPDLPAHLTDGGA